MGSIWSRVSHLRSIQLRTSFPSIWGPPLFERQDCLVDRVPCQSENSCRTFTRNLGTCSLVSGFSVSGSMCLSISVYQNGECTICPQVEALGLILSGRSDYSYEPTSKKMMIFFCNTTWSLYSLDSREKMAKQWILRLEKLLSWKNF